MGPPPDDLDDTLAGPEKAPLGNLSTHDGSGATRLPDTRLVRGDVVGRYLILDHLGDGAMGSVYAAFDPELSRKVALKLVRPAPGRVDEEGAQARLVREARALAQVNHPNVVAAYDAGTVEGRVFVTMELVDGPTLSAWLEAQPRPWEGALDVMLAAGEGLAAVHERSLVHRDFKPDNVMIASDGRVLVMDFGLALGGVGPNESTTAGLTSTASLDDLGSLEQLTRQGAVLGTPAYMAPERLAGGTCDALGDQFGYCVAVYQALYGERPFGGDSYAELLYSVGRGEIRDPPASSRVPTWVRRALQRGLAVEPSERWPSMRPLLAALRADPTPRRRRWMAGGIAASLAVVWLGGTAYRRDRAEARCHAEAAKMAALRDAARDARIASAFEATGVPDGLQQWTRTRGLLDAYEIQWREAQTSVCIETTVERSLDEAHALPMRGCLDDAYLRVEALLESFEQPDRSVVYASARGAGGLPPASHCSDPDAVALVSGARRLADSAGARAVRRDLAAIEAALFREDAQDAIALAHRALDTALREDSLALVAEARGRLGDALQSDAQYPAAYDAQKQAFFEAGRAGDDLLCAEIATGLAELCALWLSRQDEAAWWLGHGELFLDRADARGSLAEASLWAQRGALEFSRGAYPSALEAFERSFELQQDLLGASSMDISNCLENVAATQTRLGDHQLALDGLERVRSIRVEAYGPGHPSTANAINTKGNVYLELGHIDDALAAFEEAAQIRRAALGPDHPDVAISINGIAVAHYTRGDLDAAAEAHERALAIRRDALSPDNARVAESLNNLAAIEYQRGNLEAALDRFREALRRWTKNGDGRTGDTAAARSNIGAVLLQLDRYSEAAEAFGEAAEVYGDLEGEDAMNTLEARRHLAVCEYRRGDLAAARRQIEDLLETTERAHPDTAFTASLYMVLGDTWRRDNRVAALEAFETARARYEAVGAAPVDRARAYRKLAKTRWAIGADLDRARSEAETALALFREAGPLGEAQSKAMEAWLADPP